MQTVGSDQGYGARDGSRPGHHHLGREGRDVSRAAEHRLRYARQRVEDSHPSGCRSGMNTPGTGFVSVQQIFVAISRAISRFVSIGSTDNI